KKKARGRGLISGSLQDNGGEGGIRTLGTLARTTVFETAPFDRSGTSPRSTCPRAAGRARGATIVKALRRRKRAGDGAAGGRLSPARAIPAATAAAQRRRGGRPGRSGGRDAPAPARPATRRRGRRGRSRSRRRDRAAHGRGRPRNAAAAGRAASPSPGSRRRPRAPAG